MDAENSLNNRLEKLERQVQNLVREYYRVHQQLESARKEASDLKAVLAEKEEEIKNFQNQHKITKIASSITEEVHEHTELKLKINEFIREIDKCIAHLSE
jgi:chromosome segregation ATPase